LWKKTIRMFLVTYCEALLSFWTCWETSISSFFKDRLARYTQ
jgi:hypothetical protein